MKVSGFELEGSVMPKSQADAIFSMGYIEVISEAETAETFAAEEADIQRALLGSFLTEVDCSCAAAAAIDEEAEQEEGRRQLTSAVQHHLTATQLREDEQGTSGGSAPSDVLVWFVRHRFNQTGPSLEILVLL